MSRSHARLTSREVPRWGPQHPCRFRGRDMSVAARQKQVFRRGPVRRPGRPQVPTHQLHSCLRRAWWGAGGTTAACGTPCGSQTTAPSTAGEIVSAPAPSQRATKGGALCRCDGPSLSCSRRTAHRSRPSRPSRPSLGRGSKVWLFPSIPNPPHPSRLGTLSPLPRLRPHGSRPLTQGRAARPCPAAHPGLGSR